MKKLGIAAIATLGLFSAPALANEGGHIPDVQFSFEGPFGKFDKAQLQRGLQVYTEVCSSCHGLQYVPIRTLSDEGGPEYSEADVRAYAAEHFTAYDPEKDEDVPAKPFNHFPKGADPNAPDLSLMAKKRAAFHGPYGTGLNQLFRGIGGPEYITAILTGFEDAPDCAPDDMEGNYNVNFANGGYPEQCKIRDKDGKEIGRMAPGSWMAMPQPLSGEDVEFADGHSNEIHHEAEDVAAFLMWTAEPKMMARKQAGFVGVLMLVILSTLLYLTNKRIWAPYKGTKKH